MKKGFLHSLQGRYILFAGILGVVVLVGSFWGYQDLKQSSREATANLQKRDELLELTRKIRIALFDASRALNMFLLDPTRTQNSEKTYKSIQDSQQYVSELQAQPWIREYSETKTVAELQQAIQVVYTDASEMFAIRADPALEYPALAVGNTVMRPNRNSFNNAIALVMNEFHEEGIEDIAVYEAFVTVRHLWDQMVSNFRLYLANRVGSFDESALPVQEHAIETMCLELIEKLQELLVMNEAGRLGFQSSTLIHEMVENLQQWYTGFKTIRTIHHSDNWRTDVRLMTDTLNPHLSEVTSLLAKLDDKVELSVKDDIELLTRVARRQIQILWLVAVVSLLFFIVSIISMNRLIFRPIAAVTRALKAESFGKEGDVLPDVHSQETQGLIDAFAEMRKQIHSRQSDLEHQALHDVLTNLPNRCLLLDRMEQAVNIARRERQPFTLLMIDLDRFKEVNDTLGHHIGDYLLIDVGARLQKALRSIDTVARLGGDELAILLPNTDAEQAKNISLKLQKAIQAPFEIDELQLYVGASIGIAIYPEHGVDAQTLIRRADVAMYVAKRQQLDFALYNPREDEYSIGRLELIGDLRAAVENDELQLQFQPKLDLHTGDVLGVEALLRWEHSAYGAIPPDQVVTLAEQTGLINSLTYWVIDNAIKQCAYWVAKDIRICMAVNLSVHNLNDAELINKVQESLQAHGLPANYLILEITENAMMSNPMYAIDILTQLDLMGVKLSIDDFGTGYSSLAYLKQLPVDELKIDRSFVMGLTKAENSSDEVIVKSTIELAHNLGLKVTAEGVETEACWLLLRYLNCDAAQGYYMSKPLSVDALDKWLLENAVVTKSDQRQTPLEF